jgi:hypothetical protein
MKWLLRGDWPVSQGCIPADTIISAIARDGELVEAPKWNGVTLPPPMPLNAVALDEEAALMMLKWHPEQWHRLYFGPGIDPDTIKARAAAKRSTGEWPRWS